MATEGLHYDLVVIGSGPAGYRAAVQAAKMKKSVAMIEATPGRLGGTWIHTGTIPSKTLRESMDSIHSIKFHAGPEWVDRIIRDLPAAHLAAQAVKVAKYEENIVRRYLARYQITLYEGFGSLLDSRQYRSEEETGQTRKSAPSLFLLGRDRVHVGHRIFRLMDGASSMPMTS